MTASSKRDLREVFSRRYQRARCSRAKGLLLDEFCAPAMNFFQPTVTLIKKKRIGARMLRRYDRPQTPLDRVFASPPLDRAIKAALGA